jgi:hypothetical protein
MDGDRQGISPWLIGGLATVGLVGLAALLLAGDEDADKPTEKTSDEPSDQPNTPADAPQPEVGWTNLRPLPTADDVAGFNLDKNWGKTPTALRPLFALMERHSGIDGSARLFAAIATRESNFVATAHNNSDAERKASRRAYNNIKDRNPPLPYGEQAAEYGSGGLFGALAPYFLWTGVPEVGDRAPLLSAPPEIMLLPRVAAFAACVYLQRLVAHYRLDDHLDIKVGWASPSLLVDDGRGSSTYKAVRDRFNSDVLALGIDLTDTSTIPKKLSAERWPGVPKVFAELVGQLPVRKK